MSPYKESIIDNQTLTLTQRPCQV